MLLPVWILRKQVPDYFRCLGQIVVSFIFCQFLDNNNVFFIHRRDKIPGFSSKQTSDPLKLVSIFLTVCLDNIDGSSNVRFDMKFFGAIINIYQQQIIQQQIFDKIVFIKTFLVCNQQILNLKTGNLANHINIVALSAGEQHILQLMFVEHLEKLASLHYLTVSRRLHKDQSRIFISFTICKCRCQNFTLGINHT